jgi:dUTP pyrophosphatase
MTPQSDPHINRLQYQQQIETNELPLPDYWHTPAPDTNFNKQPYPDTETHGPAFTRVLHSHHPRIKYPMHKVRIQVDGGANQSVTNDISILTGFRNIKRYAMSGVSSKGPAIHCTGMGFIPWKADTSETVFVKCYYSQDATETIISPTDVIDNHIANLNAWGQHCNIDTGHGWIKLYYRNEDTPITYTLTNINNLWYHDGTGCTIEDYDYTLQRTQPLVRRLARPAQYELYHQRFGHPGQQIMSILHKHVDHVPPLKGHPLYKCTSCEHSKSRQHAHNHNDTPSTSFHPDNKDEQPVPQESTQTESQEDVTSDPTKSLEETDIQCGHHFSIDYGFMKGSGYCIKDEEVKTITSIDGYRSYCLIIDRKSRYTWVFLTKTKTPPLEIMQQFLKQHSNTTATRKTIQTDEGGELWNSHQFLQLVMDAGYLLEPTAAGAPFQNGMAERPNQTYGNMVRCLLHSAALGPEYWSFALLHAVYLKNRLPHTAVHETPYKIYTGQRPSAKHLRIFGCPIIAKQPGKRPTKLDIHTSSGRFLGYTATDKNIYYRDDHTHRIKITTHCSFDEAGMTLPPTERLPSSIALQQYGVSNEITTTNEADHDAGSSNNELMVTLLSDHAKLPERATDDAAGYDVYSARQLIIKPGQRALIPLDITVKPPPGTYIQIPPRSSMAVKHDIDTKAGVIDADYTGNVTVVLHNSSPNDFTVNIGDRIAQFLIIHIATPIITPTDKLPDTHQGTQGFGHTGTTAILRQMSTTEPPSHATEVEMPYDIYMSQNPFDREQTIEIAIKGDHPTLGMQMDMCQHRHRLNYTTWL